MATIYTLGHGARSAVELIAILWDAQIETLIDVRAYPASRRHPQFCRESLERSLTESGITYAWQGKALGGYRETPYPEYMKTTSFREAASALAARAERSCIMCAESNPEHCHRLHIAEWLVRHGQRVIHLLAPGRSREHALNPQEELWRDV
jgi:uncharacterized protein (DUF488 family)